MLSLLAAVIRAFTPLAFVAGLLLAWWSNRGPGKASRSFIIGIAVGLLSGVAIYLLAALRQSVTAARVLLASAAVVGALLHAGLLCLSEDNGTASPALRRGAAAAFLAALASAAVFSFLDLMAEQGLSAVTVMNTELILNLGAVAGGACLTALLVPLTSHIAPRSGRRAVSGCLLAASALLLAPWCAEVLLGLMRLKVVAVAGGALTFVAKATKFAAFVPYIHLALAAGLALRFFLKRAVPKADALSALEDAPRRLARAGMRSDARWSRASAALLCALLALLLSHDLYASRPPAITRPVRLTPDASGHIRVKTADVADGGLHRFSYVTDDGHVVRFLLVKLSSRSAGTKIGVVYDACVMCGDKGYIQRKQEVICLACNVRIFNPSIGKEGGCNPIPLKHAVEGDFIVISAAELDLGARHFSQVVSIRVKDPVTGRDLDSLKARSRYEYKGRNYFFESDASQERFLASPDAYSGTPAL